MGTWERILAALRREKRELDEVVDDVTERGNAALDRREAEMKATPEERLEMEQERAAEVDAEFEAARRRIQGEDDAGS
jgi:hypothetical protein